MKWNFINVLINRDPSTVIELLQLLITFSELCALVKEI